MSITRIILRIVIVLVCALVGAGLGVRRQVVRIVGRTQEFVSLAKVVAGGQLVFNDNVTWREQQQDFYGTITETLESAEMKRRALERVRALNPDLTDCDVDIRVAQTHGSAIFNILATGAEPKYTRIFLDALLDEFISFRQSIREQAQGKVLQHFLQEVVSKQKTMEDSLEKLLKARARGVGTLSVRSDVERLTARLNSQRNERDNLRLEIRTMKEDAADRAPSQARLEAIEAEVRDIEKDLDSREAALAELKTLQDKAETDKLAYEKLFEQVEKLQSSFNTQGDYVAIQERATPAFERVENWAMPAIVGGMAGGFLCGFIGLLLSLFLVRAPRQPRIPEAA